MPPDDSHALMVRLDRVLADRLRLAAFQTRRPQSVIVREALDAWLAGHEATV